MTECIQETFSFTAHFSRRVEAGFTAGHVSSDGGALLLREAERRINLLGRLAGCFRDDRNRELIEHSVEEMKGNQLRLYFSALAYTLVEALRRLGLKGTEWAQAQVDTIRRKLFKIGAVMYVSVRRIVLQMSSTYPWKNIYVKAFHALRC